LVFTVGTFPSKTFKQTGEGIEIDFAVSTLCRYAILDSMKEYLLSQKHLVKILVWAFPGAEAKPKNENSFNTGTNYAIMETHYHTVQANEILGLYLEKHYPKFQVIQYNPGVIATDIRKGQDGAHSFGWFGPILESVLSWITPTPETYVKKVFDSILTKDLEDKKKVALNKNGDIIFNSKYLDDETTERIYKRNSDLLTKVVQFENIF